MSTIHGWLLDEGTEYQRFVLGSGLPGPMTTGYVSAVPLYLGGQPADHSHAVGLAVARERQKWAAALGVAKSELRSAQNFILRGCPAEELDEILALRGGVAANVPSRKAHADPT